jgi:hypothetical protein
VEIVANCTCMPRVATKTLKQSCLMCQQPITRKQGYYPAPQGKFHWEHFQRAQAPCAGCFGGTQPPIFDELTCTTCGGSGRTECFVAELRIS